MNRIFPITHDMLIQPVASLIQHISHFGQYKIKPYSPLWVSMTSLQNFFTSSPKHHPNTFSLSLIGGWAMTTAFHALSHWSPEHMAHYHFPLAHYHSRNLHNLTHLCDIKITHYTVKPCSILLNLFPVHCHTICFTTVFLCTYLMHFVSKPNQLSDYLC